jgi:predicted enzyme related to lactoylglutathione lyase
VDKPRAQGKPVIAFGAVVYAKDLDRVAAFYSRIAGLEVVHRDHTYAQLRSGGLELVVHRIPEHIAADIRIGRPPQRREDSAVKLAFTVRDLGAARAAAAALGGIVDPAEREWTFEGCTVCDGHDPEGNVIQLRRRVS